MGWLAGSNMQAHIRNDEHRGLMNHRGHTQTRPINVFWKCMGAVSNVQACYRNIKFFFMVFLVKNSAALGHFFWTTDSEQCWCGHYSRNRRFQYCPTTSWHLEHVSFLLLLFHRSPVILDFFRIAGAPHVFNMVASNPLPREASNTPHSDDISPNSELHVIYYRWVIKLPRPVQTCQVSIYTFLSPLP